MPAARRRRTSQHEGPVKAILHTQYGAPDLLQLKEMDKPAPKDNEVLIAIHATTVSTGDCNMRNFTFVTKSMLPFAKLTFGIGKPWKARVLGTELAGEVESAGQRRDEVQEGVIEIVASTGMAGGGHAQYACLPETGACGAQAGVTELGGGSCDSVWGEHGAVFPPGPGKDSSRAGTADHRRFREHRLGRSAARQTLWRDGDRACAAARTSKW